MSLRRVLFNCFRNQWMFLVMNPEASEHQQGLAYNLLLKYFWVRVLSLLPVLKLQLIPDLSL
jgi:hypothetical protein